MSLKREKDQIELVNQVFVQKTVAIISIKIFGKKTVNLVDSLIEIGVHF